MSALDPSHALHVIRASTGDAHRALEHNLEIARADADDGAYVRYLQAVFGWLEPLEAPLWSPAWPAQVRSTERSGKTAWLLADLEARGFCGAQVRSLPRQRLLPPLASLAHRFGVAYVVEGAQLGGQALLRRLGPRLFPRPTRWLEGYGVHAAERWRSFLRALDASVCDAHDVQAAAHSARATFEIVHAWFSARGVA